MRSLPGRLPSIEVWTFVALATASIVLTASSTAVDQFRWESARAGSQPWRFITGHFVHLGWTHAAANIGALAVLAWVARLRKAGPGFPVCAACSAAAVSAGMAYGPVHIDWYAGLSGILYGLFAQEVLRLRTFHRPVAWCGLALYFAGLVKVVADLRLGVGAAGTLGIPIVPHAHLYGYLAGSLVSLVSSFFHCEAGRRRPDRPASTTRKA